MHFWLAESECFSAGNKMISTAIYQVVVISTSKLFKYNKIAQACRASAICSLWKIYKFLLHQSELEIMLLLVNDVHEKSSQKVKTEW